MYVHCGTDGICSEVDFVLPHITQHISRPTYLALCACAATLESVQVIPYTCWMFPDIYGNAQSVISKPVGLQCMLERFGLAWSSVTHIYKALCGSSCDEVRKFLLYLWKPLCIFDSMNSEAFNIDVFNTLWHFISMLIYRALCQEFRTINCHGVMWGGNKGDFVLAIYMYQTKYFVWGMVIEDYDLGSLMSTMVDERVFKLQFP